MGDQGQRLVFSQNLRQSVRDSHGQSDRRARVDAKAVEMFDAAEFSEEEIQFFVGEAERVAARQDDLLDFVVISDIVESGHKIFARGRKLRFSHPSASHTEAAIGRTAM